MRGTKSYQRAGGYWILWGAILVCAVVGAAGIGLAFVPPPPCDDCNADEPSPFEFRPVEPDGPPFRFIPIPAGNGTHVVARIPSASLPPHPGQADRRPSRVDGTDEDGDGVRDDLEHYIAERYPGREETEKREALYRYVRTLQDFLFPPLWGIRGGQSNLNDFAHAAACIRKAFDGDFAKARHEMVELEARYVNTEERFDVYIDRRQEITGRFSRMHGADAKSVECAL